MAPRTLVQLRVGIAAFAQDGDRVAWMTGRCRDPGVDRVHRGNDDVAVRTLRTGRTVTLTRRACRPRGSLTGSDRRSRLAGLVLAGTRVVFWHPAYYGGTDYVRIKTRTVAIEDRRERDVEIPGGGLLLGSGYGNEGGTFAVGSDGDGATLVLAYAVATEAELPSRCSWCTYRVTGGGVLRIDGTADVPLRGAPVPAFADAAEGMIAVIPAARVFRIDGVDDETGDDVDVPNVPWIAARSPATVEIRNASSGRVARRFRVFGTVWAFAVSNERAAVLVERRGRRRIDLYDIRTGLRRQTFRAPAATTELDVDGRTVIYRSGRNIHVSERARQLRFRASATPIGLSIEGRRVAWAENTRGRGRIRAVVLP